MLGARSGSRSPRPRSRSPAALPAIGADTAVAVVVTSLLGLGALLALSPESPAGRPELLFGDVLGVTGGELVAGRRRWPPSCSRRCASRTGACSWSASTARTRRAFGASPRAVDALLLLLVGGFTVVAVQALGSLLVLAMLVGAGGDRGARDATACADDGAGRRRSRPPAARGGLYLSYYADTAAGASIAAVLVAIHVGTAATLRLRLEPGPVAGLEAAR